MEIIREVEWGDELGIVWRDRNWTPGESDLSFEAYFKEHTEETVKAFVSEKRERFLASYGFTNVPAACSLIVKHALKRRSASCSR